MFIAAPLNYYACLAAVCSVGPCHSPSRRAPHRSRPLTSSLSYIASALLLGYGQQLFSVAHAMAKMIFDLSRVFLSLCRGFSVYPSDSAVRARDRRTFSGQASRTLRGAARRAPTPKEPEHGAEYDHCREHEVFAVSAVLEQRLHGIAEHVPSARDDRRPQQRTD